MFTNRVVGDNTGWQRICVAVAWVITLFFADKVQPMELRSNDFEHNGFIPSPYTCDGSNLSPHLAWSGAPEGTHSFALSCIDPDAPGGDFFHWLVYNIPPTVTEISRGGPLPPGAQEVANDFGKKSYGGPCPPSGTHRYFFTIYALKVNDLGTVNRQDFLHKLKQHRIASAELMGRYQRKR